MFSNFVPFSFCPLKGHNMQRGKDLLSTKYSLFWSSFKFLEIQSLFSQFLAQKLQKFFTSFFCHLPSEQNTPLSCNPIYPDSQSCEVLQLLQVPSYSRVTNHLLNMTHQHVPPSLRTLHRNKFSMNDHVKALNSLHCTLSVS